MTPHTEQKRRRRRPRDMLDALTIEDTPNDEKQECQGHESGR